MSDEAKEMENEPTVFRRYLGLALDPIHVGTGEFQLGRVDNTIVREPATGIPKIPGTSLLGPARAYTAMRTGRYLYRDSNGDVKSCAGKGGSTGDDHCGKPICPVCVTFGFSKGNDKSSFQGMASIYDARVLLFPVSSVTGPVWVTTLRVLAEAGFETGVPNGALGAGTASRAWRRGEAKVTSIRLGWMSVQLENLEPGLGDLDQSLAAVGASQGGERLVIVGDDLFGALVNDNLEIRTSVSIEPLTGTAKKGALFTAEAIPRGAVFWFSVAVQNPQYFRIGGEEIGISRTDIFKNVEGALGDMETLGVGGMNTRGFGRLRVGPLNAGPHDAKPQEKEKYPNGVE